MLGHIVTAENQAIVFVSHVGDPPYEGVACDV